MIAHFCYRSFFISISDVSIFDELFSRLFSSPLHILNTGDIGFDPLGLKPTDADKFAQIQTKELQNGRRKYQVNAFSEMTTRKQLVFLFIITTF